MVARSGNNNNANNGFVNVNANNDSSNANNNIGSRLTIKAHRPIVFGTVDYGYNRPPCMADVLGHSIGREDGASVNLAFELDRNKRKWSPVAGSFVERHMTTVS